MRLLPAAAGRRLRLQMDVIRVKRYRLLLFDHRHFLRLEKYRLFLFGDWRFLRCGWLENLIHLRFRRFFLHMLSKVEVLHRDKSISDVLFLQKRLLLCLLPGKSGLTRVAHPFFMQVRRVVPIGRIHHRSHPCVWHIGFQGVQHCLVLPRITAAGCRCDPIDQVVQIRRGKL